MCGRFALKSPPRSIQEYFHLPEEIELSPRYNIAPSQEVAVVRLLPKKSFRQLDMLHPEQYQPWLLYSTSEQSLQQLLIPYPANEMEAYPVSSEVNSPKNDSPACLFQV